MPDLPSDNLGRLWDRFDALSATQNTRDQIRAVMLASLSGRIPAATWDALLDDAVRAVATEKTSR